MHPYTQLVVGLIKETDSLYDKPRLDYHEFRDRWLPLFNKDSHSGLAPLGEWIQGVARGNAYMEVDIVKGGSTKPDEMYPPYTTVEGGEVMFTVPGLLNRDIEVKLDNGRDIASVMAEANARGQVLTAAGVAMYKAEIQDRLQIEVPVDPLLFEKMNEIFEHFGIKRTSQREDGEKKTEASNNVVNSDIGKIDNGLLDFEW